MENVVGSSPDFCPTNQRSWTVVDPSGKWCGAFDKSGLPLGLATVQNGTKLVKMTTKFSKNDLWLKKKVKFVTFLSYFQ
jgi:hypothetical protein